MKACPEYFANVVVNIDIFCLSKHWEENFHQEYFIISCILNSPLYLPYKLLISTAALQGVNSKHNDIEQFNIKPTLP